MKNRLGITIFLLMGWAAMSWSMNLSVNKSIHISDHEKSSGCSSVNGSVKIGNYCKVTGSCRTVNGEIYIGRECKIKNLQSVNGNIKIDKETQVRGSLSTVNGNITCKHGGQVSDDIESVNGRIIIYDTKVGNNITTYNGDVQLLNGSIVYDHIIVKDNKGQTNRKKPLYILIDNNSLVKGNVINRNDDFKVIVQLRNGGRIEGETHNVIIERN